VKDFQLFFIRITSANASGTGSRQSPVQALSSQKNGYYDAFKKTLNASCRMSNVLSRVSVFITIQDMKMIARALWQ